MSAFGGFPVARFALAPVLRIFAEHAHTYLDSLDSGAAELVARLLEQDPVPTGLFLPYDLLTALVYRHLQRSGVRVGRDLETVSCNNQPTCLAGLTPRPATIDVGAETIGTRAVEQLLWRVRYPDVRNNLQLLVEILLVEGETIRERWNG